MKYLSLVFMISLILLVPFPSSVSSSSHTVSAFFRSFLSALLFILKWHGLQLSIHTGSQMGAVGQAEAQALLLAEQTSGQGALILSSFRSSLGEVCLLQRSP